MSLDQQVRVVGKSLWNDSSKPVFLDLGSLKGPGVFLQVVGSDLAPGHQPLVHREVLEDISYDEVFDSIKGTDRMQAAFEFLYQDADKGKTMLSYLMITGLWNLNNQDAVDLHFLDIDQDTLESKIRNDNSFSKDEFGKMTTAAMEFIDLRTRTTVRNWIMGETVAPAGLNYGADDSDNNVLEQLSTINPEFSSWKNAAGEFDYRKFPSDVRSAYWIFRDLSNVIIGYLMKGEISPEGSETDNDAGKTEDTQGRRPVKIQYGEEISEIVRYFIGRRSEKYASPRVMSTDTLDKNETVHEPVIKSRRRANPNLSSGLVAELPDDFDGKVITILDIMAEREAVREVISGVATDYLRQVIGEHKFLYDNFLRCINGTKKTPIRMTAHDAVLSELQVNYDPENEMNDRLIIELDQELQGRNMDLYAAAIEFADDLTKKIMSHELDERYTTNGQINAALDVLSKMRDALPLDVHLWLTYSDNDNKKIQREQEKRKKRIKRLYGVEINQGYMTFAEQLRGRIRQDSFDVRAGNIKIELGYGITAFDLIANDSDWNRSLSRMQGEMKNAGAKFLTRQQYLSTLGEYGIPDTMQFVHPINFLNPLSNLFVLNPDRG